MKQRERILEFITVKCNLNGKCSMWDLERFGVEEKYLSSGSATRHARWLLRGGKIKHPFINGAIDKHSYIMNNATKQDDLFPTDRYSYDR